MWAQRKGLLRGDLQAAVICSRAIMGLNPKPRQAICALVGMGISHAEAVVAKVRRRKELGEAIDRRQDAIGSVRARRRGDRRDQDHGIPFLSS